VKLVNLALYRKGRLCVMLLWRPTV